MLKPFEEKILDELLRYTANLDPAELFPTIIPEAKMFALGNPYAFAMATCLDRGAKAGIIWTIPFDIRQRLGHLNPKRIFVMTLDELTSLFSQLPRKPRYVNAAPRTVKELTEIVVRDYNGDASKIWEGKRASEVKRVFHSIYGVGPGIASMAVLLLERGYGIRFSDMDRRNMDVKPDVHIMRVLYRLGISWSQTESAAVEAARRLNPEYPGGIDSALWLIGNKWCTAYVPRCTQCWMGKVCKKVGV
jgi:endonuclease III